MNRGTTIIPIKLRYGEGQYGKYPYKNEWSYIEIPNPDPDYDDDEEMWLIDQYREDFLN